MSKAVKVIRKFLAVIVGLPILAIGIVLIPLPGPGLLTCLLGLFILSLEFTWAESYRDKAKAQLNKIIEKAKAKHENRLK